MHVGCRGSLQGWSPERVQLLLLTCHPGQILTHSHWDSAELQTAASAPRKPLLHSSSAGFRVGGVGAGFITAFTVKTAAETIPNPSCKTSAVKPKQWAQRQQKQIQTIYFFHTKNTRCTSHNAAIFTWYYMFYFMLYCINDIVAHIIFYKWPLNFLLNFLKTFLLWCEAHFYIIKYITHYYHNA